MSGLDPYFPHPNYSSSCSFRKNVELLLSVTVSNEAERKNSRNSPYSPEGMELSINENQGIKLAMESGTVTAGVKQRVEVGLWKRCAVCVPNMRIWGLDPHHQNNPTAIPSFGWDPPGPAPTFLAIFVSNHSEHARTQTLLPSLFSFFFF